MKPVSLISKLFLFTLLIIAVSCKKQEAVNEVKINDFNALSSEFQSPSKEYTTAPFFVWNYKITKKEIDFYLDEFRKQGSLQVFVHPRPGLITEYLSDEWFDLFKYTVEKGKELGMNIWIYDENSYPSGFGGGNVPDQMPESYNQGQGLRMKKFETLPDTADRYFLCLKEENGSYINITNALGSEKGKSGKYLLFSKTYNGKSDWYGGFSYVDLLYPGVTQKFIDVTMTGYSRAVGTEFGKTVPGTFTDEPQIQSPGGIRWTPDLFEIFRKQWHYDLETCLPSLFEEVGDWKKVRHNYTQTLLNLFIDRWARPWYKYCEENGLKFTGHYWEHEWPNMRPGGDNMAMYEWHQQPAIDMLFNQYNDSSVKAQFGNVRAVKELASAANQTGRQRKLSETYGGSGWELTFAEMKKMGDWEYVLGVNLMNQHLSHITLAGARKYDYPLTFTYHEPWWNDYKYLNDHYARLSMALSSGRQVNNILIIEPTTTAWLYDSYIGGPTKPDEIGQAFQNFITKLEKNQVEYDLGSESIIRNIGSVSEGKLVVGQCSYSTVVIPPMTENLDMSTFRLIRRFVTSGGKLVAFSTPTLVDGAENKELKDFLEKNAGMISQETELNESVLNKYFLSPAIKFSDCNFGNIYHQRRELSDGEILFIVNSSLADSARGKVEFNGAGIMELNTLTGKMSEYPSVQADKSVSMSFALPPAGSLLLFVPSNKMNMPGTQTVSGSFKEIPAGPMTVSRSSENAMPVEFCDLTIDGVTTADMNTYDAADRVYRRYGFRNGNPWNTSVQFKNKIVDRDTFKTGTGFIATYHFNVRSAFDFSNVKAVIERPWLWEVRVNGEPVKPEPGEWWLDHDFGVFKIGSLIKWGDNTISLTVSPMKVNAEIEPLYIIGDFSVLPADKGWVLGPVAGRLSTGSWKDQGMPFYSWQVSYSREVSIDTLKGSYKVTAVDWKGTIAEVWVNGKKCDPIAFPPYESDITSSLQAGKNTIELKVTGSLKNILGPHFNNPSPGLVSPWMFRNVKTYPAGKDYQLLDYGLYKEFKVVNRK